MRPRRVETSEPARVNRKMLLLQRSKSLRSSHADARLGQIDDLYSGLEHDRLRLELVERRRLAVDRPVITGMDLVHRGVERLTDHVVDVTEDTLTHGHHDRAARVLHG